MQSSRNTAHGLELTSTVTDALFVDRKCLGEEFIANLLESSLICNLACCEEKSKNELGNGGGGRG